MVIKISGTNKPVEIHESEARITRNMGFVVSVARRLGTRMTIYPLPEKKKHKQTHNQEDKKKRETLMNKVMLEKRTSP